jgi:sulfatase maturation enzyme AslB (radical SAM superfamily)
MVTIGGGEPTLVKNLPTVLRILKDAGIYTSVHTNGIKLNLDKLEGLVDDIAIPIDAADRELQGRLRGKRFLKTFDRLPEIAEDIVSRGIKLVYHTVFTSWNWEQIPLIRKALHPKFDHWRIYEFNEDCALFPVLRDGGSKAMDKYLTIESLTDDGSPALGCTDSLFAQFLLTEDKMRGDPRVQFVARRDAAIPYVFLENSGDVTSYSRYSFRERRKVGNILTEPFSEIKKMLYDLYEAPKIFDDQAQDEFWNAFNDLPIWARLFEGNFWPEEVEAIDAEYHDDLCVLAQLYSERV